MRAIARARSGAVTVLTLVVTVLIADNAMAAVVGAPKLDGALLNLFWVIPFVGVLLSIAIFPLVTPTFWHHHFGKVSAFWAVAFLGPFAVFFGYELAEADHFPPVIGVCNRVGVVFNMIKNWKTIRGICPETARRLSLVAGHRA